MPIVDLSHVIADGTITYPGLPGPAISDHLSREASHQRYAAGYEFQIGRIDMVSNTGTYLDTPFHRFADGHDLAGLDPARVADVPGVLVDGTAGYLGPGRRAAARGDHQPLRPRDRAVHSGRTGQGLATARRADPRTGAVRVPFGAYFSAARSYAFFWAPDRISKSGRSAVTANGQAGDIGRTRRRR